jgi:hypothetical protein
MTCVVGLLDKGTVYMGADSAAVKGTLFLNNGFILGFCGSFRMGQILQYHLAPVHPQPGQNTYEYMVTTFIEQVRDCLKQCGFAEIVNEVETGGEFLVGFKGRLFSIDNDFHVAEIAHDYVSLGSGSDIAHGSLYSTKSMKRPQDRIKLALQAAEEWSSGVRKPFMILKLVDK